MVLYRLCLKFLVGQRPTAELQPPVEFGLTPDDQAWLAGFGVDPSWQDNPEDIARLHEVVTTGSLRLYSEAQTLVSEGAILEAREEFLQFICLSEETIDRLRNVSLTLVPLDTLIQTQRTMHQLGLNGAKLVNTQPSILTVAPGLVREKVDNFTKLGLSAARVINNQPTTLGYAVESVREKLTNLSDLGLDAIKVVNMWPAVLSLAPKSVREKIHNLNQLGLNIVTSHPTILSSRPESVRERLTGLGELGLDAAKILNTLPTMLSLAPQSVQRRMNELTEMGLDAAKVVNSQPTILSYASESVREKLDNLTQLGLDATKMANTSPAILSLAPGTVQRKVNFIERNIKLLGWHHSAQELIELFPGILATNLQKLAILCRIAASNVNESGRAIPPNKVKPALIRPLENYLIALQSSGIDSVQDFEKLASDARRVKLSPAERREKALELAPTLGTIGAMYLRYRNRR